MRVAAAGLILLAAIHTCAASEDPNGAFESWEQGCPTGWSPIGEIVEETSDAHGGQHAVRLTLHPANTTAAAPHEGHVEIRSLPVAQLRGAIGCWYKAVAESGAGLTIGVIPVDTQGDVCTAAAQTTITLQPGDAMGSTWREVRLAYDYSAAASVSAVRFTAGMTGLTGEWMLDDAAFLEAAGPWLLLQHFRFEESPDAPGQAAAISLEAFNAGDAPATNIRGVLEVPDSLNANPPEIVCESLASGGSMPFTWTLNGMRKQPGEAQIRVTEGEQSASMPIAIAPKLQIEHFGAETSTVTAGNTLVFECRITNTGTAFAMQPKVEFRRPGNIRGGALRPIAPGQTLRLQQEFDFPEPNPSVEVSVMVRAANMPGELHAVSKVAVVPRPADSQSATMK